MRISIALSLLILAIGAALGWQDHQRLTIVRAGHAKLVAEAAKSGITLDPTRPENGLRTTKRERENKEIEAKKAAAEFIAFAKEMETVEKKGSPPDEATQKKSMAIMDRMMSLDAAQLKILIAEVRAAKDLKDETRQGLIGFSVMTLASDHPQAGLTLFTESSDLFTKDSTMAMGQQVISSSLAKWAKDDPTAALDWLSRNGEKFPDLIYDNAKRGMISGVAANDPKLAFKLIGELETKGGDGAIRSIIDAAKTPENRTATLAALREHFASLPEGEVRDQASSSAIQSLAQNAAKDGFEAGSKWIDNAGLTLEQLAGIAEGSFYYNIRSDETGRWIEWMGKTLPVGKSDDGIRNLVNRWTEKDYRAAGKWLSSSPDGPAKNVSIRAYAETVSEYEPETAAQWAMTLPPGKDREETLKNIYQNWPKDDEAAKEAFSKLHGIE